MIDFILIFVSVFIITFLPVWFTIWAIHYHNWEIRYIHMCGKVTSWQFETGRHCTKCGTKGGWVSRLCRMTFFGKWEYKDE